MGQSDQEGRCQRGKWVDVTLGTDGSGLLIASISSVRVRMEQ